MTLMVTTKTETTSHPLAYGSESTPTSTRPDPRDIADAYRIARDYRARQRSDLVDWASEALVWDADTLEWAERSHGVVAEALALDED